MVSDTNIAKKAIWEKNQYLYGSMKKTAKAGRKVICSGEIVLDIIMKDGQPLSANPGGSTFNTAVSLGRAGVETCFVGEIGGDDAGKLVKDFLAANGVSTGYLYEHAGHKTNLSLAFLDERNDAHYSFYRDEPGERPHFTLPEINPGDVVVFGSYFAVAPQLRGHITRLLGKAVEAGAIVYYDINFRPSHAKDLSRLRPFITGNIASSDIVRASVDDLATAFGGDEPECRCFIRTDGPRKIVLRDVSGTSEYPVEQIDTLSTIGAGDSFNAGIAYGLIKEGVSREDLLAGLPARVWDDIIGCARAFSQACCRSLENYVPADYPFVAEHQDGGKQ